jgi:hypothetical protein
MSKNEIIPAGTTIWFSRYGHYDFIYRSDSGYLLTKPLEVTAILNHKVAIVNTDFTPLRIVADSEELNSVKPSIIWIQR